MDFRDWSLDREEVPCREATFERLLGDAGFLLANGFVNGLTLKTAWEARQESKNTCADVGRSAKSATGQ
jgi:hypothetical protein